MNTIFILLSTLILGTALAQDLSSNISSDYASYDGDFLRLIGNVKLDHDLGQMQANQALLKKGEKDFPFTKIYLEKNVFFSFENNSELFCDRAELDFLEHLGKVLSHENPVLYRNRKKEVFDLFSQQIDFQFQEKEEDILEISSLLAKGHVHINYTDKYQLDADEASLKKDTLSTYQINCPCRLTHLQNEVQANRITLHLENRNFEIETPRGKIASFFFPNAPNRLCRFSSKELSWDDMDSVMTLKNEIFIQDDFLGTIEGKDMLRFFQKEQFGKYVIQAIKSTGPTTLKSALSASDEQYILTSFGTLSFDRDLLLVTATSPKVHNNVPLDKQLTFTKGDLTLYADELLIEYNIYQLALKPTVVDLQGHVRLFSNNRDAPFCCGFADEVRLNPQTKQLRLLAKPENQVLFWHEEQNLKLCAQEIVVTPDPKTGKDIIKGIGNVRFSFNEKQEETFHHLFLQGELDL